MNKTINPELALAGARMAVPSKDWYIADWTKRVIHNDGLDVPLVVFNPLTSDSDAWALERALKKEGYHFGQYASGLYYAHRSGDKANWRGPSLTDDSDTLLLKCLSAQTGIPMYVELVGRVG